MNAACKKLRQSKSSVSCCYYQNVGDLLTPNNFGWDKAQDIENLHELGQKHKVCPYFLQRNRTEFADLILMPYNYLFDEKLRTNFKVRFEDAVVIMDEAHNVVKIAEDVASFDLSLAALL